MRGTTSKEWGAAFDLGSKKRKAPNNKPKIGILLADLHVEQLFTTFSKGHTYQQNKIHQLNKSMLRDQFTFVNRRLLSVRSKQNKTEHHRVSAGQTKLTMPLQSAHRQSESPRAQTQVKTDRCADPRFDSF